MQDKAGAAGAPARGSGNPVGRSSSLQEGCWPRAQKGRAQDKKTMSLSTDKAPGKAGKGAREANGTRVRSRPPPGGLSLAESPAGPPRPSEGSIPRGRWSVPSHIPSPRGVPEDQGRHSDLHDPLDPRGHLLL